MLNFNKNRFVYTIIFTAVLLTGVIATVVVKLDLPIIKEMLYSSSTPIPTQKVQVVILDNSPLSTQEASTTPETFASVIVTAPALSTNLSNSVPITLTVSSLYLIAQQGTKRVEVWQYLPDNKQWITSFSTTRRIDESIDTLIPTEEIEELQSFLQTQSLPLTTSIRDLNFEPRIWQLALSSTGNNLVDLERVAYCFEEFHDCFGIWRVINFDLTTGQPQLLLQVPINNYASLSNFLWSQNGQYLAFGDYRRNESNTLVVANVNTEQIRELTSEVDLEGPLAWSPDSNTIALHLSRWHTQSSGGAVRLCTVQEGQCQDIELDGLWIYEGGIDWSPNGEQLVFSAVDADPNSFSSGPVELYLLDPKARAVRKIPVNFSKVLENPHWSPDGQFIAVDYSEKTEDKPRAVIIIEPVSGKIINQIPLEGCTREWTWGQDSSSIWQITCQTGFRHSLKIVDIYDLSSKLLSLPEVLQEKWISFDTLKYRGGTYTR